MMPRRVEWRVPQPKPNGGGTFAPFVPPYRIVDNWALDDARGDGRGDVQLFGTAFALDEEGRFLIERDDGTFVNVPTGCCRAYPGPNSPAPQPAFVAAPEPALTKAPTKLRQGAIVLFGVTRGVVVLVRPNGEALVCLDPFDAPPISVRRKSMLTLVPPGA